MPKIVNFHSQELIEFNFIQKKYSQFFDNYQPFLQIFKKVRLKKNKNFSKFLKCIHL
jgi:hypothetical protein